MKNEIKNRRPRRLIRNIARTDVMDGPFWWSEESGQGRCRKMDVGCSVMQRTTELQQLDGAGAWVCKSGEMRKVTLLGTRTGIYWYPPFLGIHRMIPATAECRESWMEEAGLGQAFSVFPCSELLRICLPKVSAGQCALTQIGA